MDVAELLDDAAMLADFRHTAYARVLGKLYERHLEKLKDYALASATAEQFWLNRGRVEGVRELMALPDAIVQMAARSGAA